MKLNKPFFLTLILSLILTSVCAGMFFKGSLKRLELGGIDFFFRYQPKERVNPRIVIIEISDSDVEALGRWPWKRASIAALTRILTELGAKQIFFDIVFSEPSEEFDDGAFEQAIRESGNVYLPMVLPTRAVTEAKPLFPLSRFSQFARGIGSINVYPDIDGTIRRLPLVVTAGGTTYPTIAMRLVMDDLDLDIQEVGRDRVVLGRKGREVVIPTMERSSLLIRWTGKWQKTFKHYGYLDVVSLYKDILNNPAARLNAVDFKNSICLVGLTAVGLYDIKPVPLEAEYPGIGVTANAVNNLLSGHFLRGSPAWLTVVLIYIFGIFSVFLVMKLQPLEAALSALAVGVVYLFLALQLFQRGIVLNVVYPLTSLFASYGVAGIYHSFLIYAERQMFYRMSVTDSLMGIFNIRYFKLLLETEISISQPDPSSKFCVVMCDIDNFKKFNDTYGHQVGDLVLKETALAMRGAVRSSDILARYGGEEIIVLLRGATFKDGLSIAEKMRKNLESRLIKDDKNTYSVTASFGVAFFHRKDDADAVIKRADDGLYQAKRSGKNRVCSVETSSQASPEAAA